MPLEEATYRSAISQKIDSLDEKLGIRMDFFEKNTNEKLDEVIERQKYTNGKVAFVYRYIWLCMGFCLCLSIIVLPLIWSLIQSGKL